MEMRKIDKLEGTFLKSFEEEIYDDVMHPFLHLHLARSSRSSSSNPNVQNIPKRDKEAMEIVRGGIFPKKGCEIVGADFKQIEVAMQACASLDTAMMEYVTDENSDMHRDSSLELFMIDEDQMSKPLRQLGKNGFNFPQLYGDWHKSIATAIWKDICRNKVTLKDGTLVVKHLASKGIRNYEAFEKHVKRVEESFWSKFFATQEWRARSVEDYKVKGYVSTLTGFRRTGLLRRNELCNTKIQSIAGHCLFWSFVEINKVRKLEKWKSSIIFQVHDQIVFNIYPDEKEHILKVVDDIMTNKVREHFKWIVVPLRVSYEFSGLDQKWSLSEEE
jgi:DNA polymerase-1